MGWAHCGTDSTGRDIGYAIEATCDHPGCTTVIDRGLSYACGGMHGEEQWYCEHYFCGEHLLMTSAGQLCPTCYERFMAAVCQEWKCTEEATGTLVDGTEHTRMCIKHGQIYEGTFIPDHPVRIAKLDGEWELVDGWSEERAARIAGESRIIATDRATGAAVWLVFGEGEAFQVEPVE